MSQPFALAMDEQAVQEFFIRWCAGLQPSLLLETQSNGDISMSSRVTCGVTLPQQSEQADWPHSHGHPYPPCRQGPSRLRRRARRAHARATAEAAANAASPKTPDTAVEAVKPFETEDAAVQAVGETSTVAVQADVITPQPKHAEQAGRPLEHAAQAAGHPQQASPPAAQAVPALSGHRVRDEFCLFDFYKLLQEQSKTKENQMRDLSEKRSFGFKPSSAKKPF